jgi:hypothetical protein
MRFLFLKRSLLRFAGCSFDGPAAVPEMFSSCNALLRGIIDQGFSPMFAFIYFPAV